jgi:cation diffusion facilitator family transporter
VLGLIKFLIRKFIKNSENVNDRDVREAYGVLSGVLGIICNVFLFVTKLIIGMFINSIAVISDAFNNLSDMGTSVITIFGAKLSNRPPDKEHPHGHGRYEYIASLIVSFVIFAVGFKLLSSSFDKILKPQKVLLNTLSISILVISVLVKVWMFSYNKYIGKVINSSVNRATAFDSLNDVYATSAVIVGTVIGTFVSLPIDGIMGIVISGLIMYTGFKTAKDSVDLLLGVLPDPEIIGKINEMVLSCKSIKGIHDLKIHDYGPGRITASIHAEVSDNENIVDIHTEIDKIELKVKEELGIDMVIHMDPVE